MANVLKTFQDLSTEVIYPIGSDYEGERLKEFQELGFVEAPKKSNKKATKESES